MEHVDKQVDKQVESQPKAEQDKDQPKAEQAESQPKAEQTEKKQKTPKRVEQGPKLAEWNKQNKQRLSRSAQPATQPATHLTTQLTTHLTTQPEATRTDETSKHNTKDYVLLTETILIVGLVGVGLYYFANQNDQPVEISVKERAQLEPVAAAGSVGSTAATSLKDMFNMQFFF